MLHCFTLYISYSLKTLILLIPNNATKHLYGFVLHKASIILLYILIFLHIIYVLSIKFFIFKL
ncbi:hypothetical protein AMV046 [Betaentomopoxvirus amoorei]|uniref:AMV046 n=1 Tax=Amsacta moorei entomopoxvirus TaxID=28321 RepID=Q9EN02_AMEPV|nr:hypothetical protein AMV046 [Amsacta moorei entomopoxvirus]AAG02752.1 AMV046 [Amsacta moorei entomopoxvirus]